MSKRFIAYCVTNLCSSCRVSVKPSSYPRYPNCMTVSILKRDLVGRGSGVGGRGSGVGGRGSGVGGRGSGVGGRGSTPEGRGSGVEGRGSGVARGWGSRGWGSGSGVAMQDSRDEY